ncbi:MAG: DUF58 domain-containing protein [Pseudomonadota bacterium]
MTATTTHGRAEALAATLPALQIEAERVAATVAQGVHGRRRVGVGESFWQFRPYEPGDPVQRIDWRQTAKRDRPFLRQLEWEASQTAYLWRAVDDGFRWHSSDAVPTKIERADLLLLALASLLNRAGERVALLDGEAPPGLGRTDIGKLALDLMRPPTETSSKSADLPPQRSIQAHSSMVLFADWLAPLEAIENALAPFQAKVEQGHLVQILDPAEVDLPYDGRIRFTSFREEPALTMARVDTIRQAYQERLSAQQDGLRALAQAAGWRLHLHRTDQPPERALLAIFQSLADATSG